MSIEPNSKNQTVFKDEEEVGENEGETTTKTQSGLDENIAGTLCYLAWAITGIVFLIIEKENHFVRFHALQSIITSVAIFVISIILSIIPVIGLLISLLLAPATLVLWLFMMWKAYQGEKFKLPFVGDFAEKQLNSN